MMSLVVTQVFGIAFSHSPLTKCIGHSLCTLCTYLHLKTLFIAPNFMRPAWAISIIIPLTCRGKLLKWVRDHICNCNWIKRWRLMFQSINTNLSMKLPFLLPFIHRLCVCGCVCVSECITFSLPCGDTGLIHGHISGMFLPYTEDMTHITFCLGSVKGRGGLVWIRTRSFKSQQFLSSCICFFR